MKRATRETVTDTDDGIIRIERRELIAEVGPGDGPNSMLEVAFLTMAGYIAENLHGAADAVALEFTWGDHRFNASAEPRTLSPTVKDEWTE